MIQRSRILIVCLLAVAGSALLSEPASAAEGWLWPVAGDVITSYKNGSDPYAGGQHRGIDIASPVGTRVRSSIGGSVSYAGNLPDGGITATVRSADGLYLVSYLHLGKLDVKRGDQVTAGQGVGTIGTTGKRSATAPHLHLSVRIAGSGAYLDPMTLLGPRPATPTPVAEAPAAAKPIEHAAPQAKSESRQRTRAQSPQRTSARSPQRATGKARQPQNVHAPATGDSVPAESNGQQSNRAAGSVRESHAPSGKESQNGRVAPPPLKATNPESVNLTTPGRAEAEAQQAAAAEATSGPPYLSVLLFLFVATALALAVRRRRSSAGGFVPPPLAHRTDLGIDTSAKDADVVSLRAVRRRA